MKTNTTPSPKNATLKLTSETLRLLKLRKVVLDFDNYDDLLIYMLKFTPDSYVDASKRPAPPGAK